MVSGSGSGGVDRIGGSGADSLVRLAKRLRTEGKPGGWDNPVHRDEVIRLWCEERVREWTNQRVRAQARAGRSPGPESSIGKVHQGGFNQRIQAMAVDMLGAGWAPPGSEVDGSWAESLPYEVRGMLRSRANTIEGGTTEVNKNILGERVLGLPREPDPWQGVGRGATCRAADAGTPRCWSNGEGPVGWLVFNRPEAGNAMDAADARRARGGLAGARPGPRCARHRQHRGRPGRSRPVSTWSSWPASPKHCASSPGARGAPSCA